VARGLPPETAKVLADALGKETHWAGRGPLAEGLAAVAGGLPPEQRAALLGPAAQVLADALGKEISPGPRQALAGGLAAVARGLPPETAAKALADALDKEGDGRARQALAKGLAAAVERLPPDRSTPTLRRYIGSCLRYIASYEELYEILAPALRALAQGCSLEESIETLKHPFCSGYERGLFLGRVEQVTGRKFRTRWEMVDWLGKNHPKIDLSAPPHLEE
jgi:hypothetical protein